ncbi:uncharacterized protein LOC144288221 [Canis aureus]
MEPCLPGSAAPSLLARRSPAEPDFDTRVTESAENRRPPPSVGRESGLLRAGRVSRRTVGTGAAWKAPPVCALQAQVTEQAFLLDAVSELQPQTVLAGMAVCARMPPRTARETPRAPAPALTHPAS